MPTLNPFSSRPQGDPLFDDEVEDWALPLGRVGGVKFHLSYSVFVAFAVLLGLIAMVKDRMGNSDLPMVAMIGLGFWTCGWFVQVVVHLAYRFAGNYSIHTLTIGLRGVETRSRSWPAGVALAVSFTSLFALIGIGAVFLLVESLTHGQLRSAQLVSIWTAPSFGLVSTDTVWLAGAWFCWIQAICQIYPLPRSLGRVLLASVVSLCSKNVDETIQAWIARRLIVVVTLTTAFVACAMLAIEPTLSVQRAPLLMIIALLLWISARSPDMFDMMLCFGSYEGFEPMDEASVAKVGWTTSLRQSIRWRLSRRRLKYAMEQERIEASDEARLDEVLERLHKLGRDGLPKQDQDLLLRVSKRMQKAKEAGQDDPLKTD